ncbi:hypothetical protein [Enterococcus pallens]|uniref:Uncharacterized protein n=1 Tax=Enterococcus pallens ATCC BAA-351 TaxID=1158607 RepID=R2SUD2_9ENTE|nr:hypothetical protein [Enterococcus pallens]EOH96406.1 hypothetical protein UAU_01057 [Enterococcus pallens ATCC BAA-351]EOU14381.1 hypothetical protein I588_04737 [Enterococcus pallens ATCC BAA-351]OJG77312.1 hypothetical protein RV10_GL002569 [Enterococcus pallens]
MKSLTGTVTKIKIVNMTPSLIFFKLDNVNCLIARNSLNFFADASEGMKVTIAGYYNKRNQFIVQRYCINGQTQLMIDVETIQNREKVFA